MVKMLKLTAKWLLILRRPGHSRVFFDCYGSSAWSVRGRNSRCAWLEYTLCLTFVGINRRRYILQAAPNARIVRNIPQALYSLELTGEGIFSGLPQAPACPVIYLPLLISTFMEGEGYFAGNALELYLGNILLHFNFNVSGLHGIFCRNPCCWRFLSACMW